MEHGCELSRDVSGDVSGAVGLRVKHINTT